MEKLDDFGMDKGKNWEPDNEKPWNEYQWEKFLEENERLMEKYRKVEEENPDIGRRHPSDLYYKVHYDLDPIDVCKGRDCEKCEDKDDCETYYLENKAGKQEPEISDEDKRLWEEERRQDQEKLESIECHRLACKFSNSLKKVLKKKFDLNNLEKEPSYVREIVEQLLKDSFQVQVEILRGHCMGYEDDVLCANIVHCKWAKRKCDKTIEALNRLKDAQAEFSNDVMLHNIEVEKIKKEISIWIEELRSKVWWA